MLTPSLRLNCFIKYPTVQVLFDIHKGINSIPDIPCNDESFEKKEKKKELRSKHRAIFINRRIHSISCYVIWNWIKFVCSRITIVLLHGKRFVSFEIITYVQTGEKTASIFFFFWRSTNRTSSTSRIPPPPLFHPLLSFHDRTRAQHRNKTSDRYY